MSLVDFSNDIILLIGYQCSTKSICNISATCKRFRTLLTTENFWRALLLRDFDVTCLTEPRTNYIVRYADQIFPWAYPKKEILDKRVTIFHGKNSVKIPLLIHQYGIDGISESIQTEEGPYILLFQLENGMMREVRENLVLLIKEIRDYDQNELGDNRRFPQNREQFCENILRHFLKLMMESPIDKSQNFITILPELEVVEFPPISLPGLWGDDGKPLPVSLPISLQKFVYNCLRGYFNYRKLKEKEETKLMEDVYDAVPFRKGFYIQKDTNLILTFIVKTHCVGVYDPVNRYVRALTPKERQTVEKEQHVETSERYNPGPHIHTLKWQGTQYVIEQYTNLVLYSESNILYCVGIYGDGQILPLTPEQKVAIMTFRRFDTSRTQ